MDDDSTIMKKIKSAVTDTDSSIRVDWENKPGVSNLLSIHSSISGESLVSLEERFAVAGYGVLKGEVADVVINALGPIRDRANDLMSDPTELDKLLASGAEKARAVAEQTLATVYDRIGFIRAS
jgi:tryptophanyl-tRNA synthetase